MVIKDQSTSELKMKLRELFGAIYGYDCYKAADVISCNLLMDELLKRGENVEFETSLYL